MLEFWEVGVAVVKFCFNGGVDLGGKGAIVNFSLDSRGALVIHRS